MTTIGTELIAAERQRQIDVEGWAPEHDDEHHGQELVRAARAYLFEVLAPHQFGFHPQEWPWETPWWKPSPDPVRNLIKAGALVAAEIDRLQREASASS